MSENMTQLLARLAAFTERAESAEAELLAVREDNHSMMLEIDGLRTERDRLAAELQKLREQMEVEWRPVVGFDGLYEVSSNGDIRNVQTGNIAAKSLMGDGYVKADLWKKGKRKQTSAHRVVAEAFIGGIDGLEINHRNGVKTDNRVSNLEITTRSGNVNHSYYELGHIIKPILATNIATGDTTEYRSIEEAVRLGGFRSSSIYDCLNGKVKTHSGHSFSRPTAPVPTPAAPDDIHELAYELGGTDSGEYHLEPEDLDRIIAAAKAAPAASGMVPECWRDTIREVADELENDGDPKAARLRKILDVLPAPAAPKAPDRHVCGLQGFGNSLDDVCPSCAMDHRKNIAPAVHSHPDDAAVDRFAAAMKAKMAASRAKGRGGWEDKDYCQTGSLQQMLIGHLSKGDPVDVGNFCMMLWNRGEPVAAPAAPAAPAPSVPDGDDFNGTTPHLIQCMEALVRLDADGVLVPHGIGRSASRLLSAAANRLQQQAAPSVPEEWRDMVAEMLTWWDDQHTTLAQGRAIREKARALLQSAEVTK